VRAMWLMLQQAEPDDFVIATGQLHTVQEVVEAAFATVHLEWQTHVKQDSRFLRPTEPLHLVGNAEKARQRLGWQPQVSFQELVREMTEAELASLAKPASSEKRD